MFFPDKHVWFKRRCRDETGHELTGDTIDKNGKLLLRLFYLISSALSLISSFTEVCVLLCFLLDSALQTLVSVSELHHRSLGKATVFDC